MGILNLSGKKLDYVPSSLLRKPAICGDPEDGRKVTCLRVSYNRLIRLPEEINKMKNLLSLDVSHNMLFFLPEAIIHMNLQTINLSYNRFKYFPTELYELRYLLHVNISNNKLCVFVGGTKLTTYICTLDASHNKLTKWPGFREGTRIKELNLSHNCITQLPAEAFVVFQKGINNINLSYNAIRGFYMTPQSILFTHLIRCESPLISIKIGELNLKGNKLKKIPNLMAKYAYAAYEIDVLDLSENHIKVLDFHRLKGTKISKIKLSRNKINTIYNFDVNEPHCSSIRIVDLRENNISSFPDSLAMAEYDGLIKVLRGKLKHDSEDDWWIYKDEDNGQDKGEEDSQDKAEDNSQDSTEDNSQDNAKDNSQYEAEDDSQDKAEGGDKNQNKHEDGLE